MRLTAILYLPIDPRLKNAIGDAADARKQTMNEYVARVLADAVGQPGLAEIPRKSRVGRPRKKEVTSS